MRVWSGTAFLHMTLRWWWGGDLFGGNASGLIIVAVHDGLLVDAGARHVAALPDHQEGGPHVLGIGLVGEGLQPTQSHQGLRQVNLAGGVPVQSEPVSLDIHWRE